MTLQRLIRGLRAPYSPTLPDITRDEILAHHHDGIIGTYRDRSQRHNLIAICFSFDVGCS